MEGPKDRLSPDDWALAWTSSQDKQTSVKRVNSQALTFEFEEFRYQLRARAGSFRQTDAGILMLPEKGVIDLDLNCTHAGDITRLGHAATRQHRNACK